MLENLNESGKVTNLIFIILKNVKTMIGNIKHIFQRRSALEDMPPDI